MGCSSRYFISYYIVRDHITLGLDLLQSCMGTWQRDTGGSNVKVIQAYCNDEDENSKIVTMHFNRLTSLAQKTPTYRVCLLEAITCSRYSLTR